MIAAAPHIYLLSSVVADDACNVKIQSLPHFVALHYHTHFFALPDVVLVRARIATVELTKKPLDVGVRLVLKLPLSERACRGCVVWWCSRVEEGACYVLECAARGRVGEPMGFGQLEHVCETAPYTRARVLDVGNVVSICMSVLEERAT